MPHAFPVPAGAVASVKIIDTTSKIRHIAADYLMQPSVAGFTTMPEIPSWSFLVESASTGRKALFDLGVPKHWQAMAPEVVRHIRVSGWDVEVQQDTADILVEHGYSLEEVGSVIWSHWHWDHLGDPSTFPSSTELVVGPGFKEKLMPGYPVREAAETRESDFKGRQVREVDFSHPSTVSIGAFKALNFFGDGSFYLLDTPGHAIGHLCGLARTTSGGPDPDTFIFMGGDICHHGGELRPSRYIPLPAELSPHPLTRALQPTCPGASFEAIQTKRGRAPDEPFFDPAMGLDIPVAIESIRKAQQADADDHVLFIYAHDTSVYGVADLFPLTANDWQKRGWRDKMFWAFLADFEHAFREEQRQRGPE